MDLNDPNFMFEDVFFHDNESTRKYIDTAISKNIQHALKNDNFGEYFNELTNIINRIVENTNHLFLLNVIEEKFKSHDLASAKNLLLHDAPLERAYVLTSIDREKVIDKLKTIIEIKEKSETKIKVTDEHIKIIKKYLLLLI